MNNKPTENSHTEPSGNSKEGSDTRYIPETEDEANEAHLDEIINGPNRPRKEGSEPKADQ